MSEIQVIQGTLERTARRCRWQRGWRMLWRGLFAGAALWLLVVSVYKVVPLPAETLIVAAALAGALMLIGFLVGFWRRPTLLETARWVDERQHFQERLSTALEVAGSTNTGNWRELILADAAGRVREFDPRSFLPLHLPLIARWALLLLV